MIEPERLRAAIGPNVRKLRTARQWSQQELADKVGCRVQHISRIETGAMSPSSELLFALADAFGIATDALRAVSENLSASA